MKQPWSATERDLVLELYPDMPTKDLAALLARSVGSVYQYAKAQGLKKSKAFFSSDLATRIKRGKLHPAMLATQFGKGAEPWNKGLKGSTGMHQNSKKTQFKAGRMPWENRSYQPIGSMQVRSDGYLYQKVNDNLGVDAKRRWTAYHRIVWEKSHGQIPNGHIIVFKAGEKTIEAEKITPEILECISRKDHANRNHPRNKCPELGRLVQLKGAINRQVNRINRENNHDSTTH
jgi:hypothetical protein